MARKWWGALLLSPLLLGAALLGAREAALARMEAGLAAWAEARRAEGWTIRHAPPRRAGFPFAAELVLEELALDTPARLGWESARVTLRLGLDDPLHARAAFAGPQALRAGGGATPVEAEALRLRAPLLGGEATLSAERLAAPGLALAGLTAHLAPATLRAEARRLSAAGLPPLEEARLAARSTTPIPGSAAAFRAAEGRLRLDEFAARSGQAALRLEAELGLDARLQPEGHGRLVVTNPDAALTALVRAGALPANLLPTLRAVLALSARPPAEGGPPRLDVALELRDRRLGAGRIPWLVLPPLDWR
ncbi:DUF2125 domain-containing protein [Rubritepida flocculans]|uniref:DUF2125 domain-containing protein n=1 Tax=Rubritepida flocculans TaxID=182403 RepID=UPI0004283DB2|nr:DUF2125 domain-containing protein [Rubritepida flocculans]